MRWLFHVAVVAVAVFGIHYFLSHEMRSTAAGQDGFSMPTALVRDAADRFNHLIPGTAAPPLAKYEGSIYYSPACDLELIDVEEIEHTRSNHLDIAMYAFTDVAIARAVVDVANRGVRVRIYRDREQWEEEQHRDGYVLSLLRANPNIAIRVKGSNTLMHLKAFCDGAVLREGSANWSPSGERRQDNTLTLTSDPQLVNSFEANFRRIWNRPNNLVVQ
jgi:phosphatidylserine/phosphatidylglycerophosphate/cardiolipin synthase-like enzyme